MISSTIKIGIVGLGLIGGSIARALKRCDEEYHIIAWDKDENNINLALADGAIDGHAKNLQDDFSQCEIIFLCIPVFAMGKIIAELKDTIRQECILTDVGSTKSDIIELVKSLNLQNPFIGGHPLAGSEKSGFASSRANLFENAYYCLTPQANTDKSALETLRSIILKIGAIPIEMSPEEHDRVVAAISHVPHIVAALLVNLVDRLDGPSGLMKTIAAGGFKDLTRIASSSPELWTGICLSNKETILDTMASLEEALKMIEQDLREEKERTILDFFKSAKLIRNSLSEGRSQYLKTFDIIVDVDDRPGIIAEIATALAQNNINIKNIGIINSRESDEGALEIRFENEDARIKGLDTLSSLGYVAKSRV